MQSSEGIWLSKMNLTLQIWWGHMMEIKGETNRNIG